MPGDDRQTRVLRVDATRPDPAVLRAAAEVLRAGGLVAFPTETVYGLGADATNPAAVAQIFAAKGRPSDNPLIVHVADPAEIGPLVADVPAAAERLMNRFWPGPLTLVLPSRGVVAPNVTAGLDTVAVRMPAHPVSRLLIQLAGVPVAAPSANRSGRPSPTRAAHVLEDLYGRVDIIIDAGETGVGLESTVVDLTCEPPEILRPGGVTAEEVASVMGPVGFKIHHPDLELGEAPRSPGMKYTHYAPRAEVIIVAGPDQEVVQKINDLAYEFAEEGKRVGVMATAENRGAYLAPVVMEVGAKEDLAQIATALFGTLRSFDQHQVDVVLAEAVPEVGIGVAIMNRLRKAAGGRVLHV
jgi:L-threonylcarbamoyladenylate synthase